MSLAMYAPDLLRAAITTDNPAAWIGDVLVPLLVGLMAVGVATLWPMSLTRHRARRAHAWIRRELEEIGPWASPTPQTETHWWEHLSRRFAHEELVARSIITDNRDFLLTLDPQVVYHLFQLWVAFDKGDGSEWSYHLTELSKQRALKSADLTNAASAWGTLIKRHKEQQPGKWEAPPPRLRSGQRPD